MGVLAFAPLVGRSQDLSVLRRAVTASWSGRATTVVLRGEAGIGKTRLVSELVSAIPRDRCRTLMGTCSTLAAREVPWGPWLDVVRELRRSFGDEAVATLMKDRLPVLAPLAPGLTPSGKRSARPPRAQLYGAMTDLLLGAAETCPVLLVLEDVQWADEDSLALLLHLTRSARTHALTVLVTARTEDPDYEDVRDRIGELERLPGAVRVDLGPLEPPDVAAYAKHLAADRLDPALTSRIVELSGGVPLFVEELVAAAERDDGTIVARPLRERLSRLSPQARALVDCLALAVAPTPPVLLLRASGTDGADFDAALAECLQAAVVVTRRGRLEFRHALLRETALGLLMPHHARELHHRWARAWEESPVDQERDLERAVASASNTAIAERLVISPKTVAVHVTHILAKLGVPSRGAAVATALRTGMTTVEEGTRG